MKNFKVRFLAGVSAVVVFISSMTGCSSFKNREKIAISTQIIQKIISEGEIEPEQKLNFFREAKPVLIEEDGHELSKTEIACQKSEKAYAKRLCVDIITLVNKIFKLFYKNEKLITDVFSKVDLNDILLVTSEEVQPTNMPDILDGNSIVTSIPTKKPEVVKKPEVTKAPEITIAPEPTKKPEATRVPEATKAPVSTPIPTKVPNPTSTPVPTATPHVHAYSDWVSIDDNLEQRSCNCGSIETRSHQYNIISDTCTSNSNGTHNQTIINQCSQCNHQKTEINTLSCTMGSWQNNGSYGEICYCSACGFSDTRSHTTSSWEENLADKSLGCYDVVTSCSTCGYTTRTTRPHQMYTTYEDEYGRDQACSRPGCGYTTSVNFDPASINLEQNMTLKRIKDEKGR